MPEQLLEGQITIITGGVEDLVDHLQGAEKVSADAQNNVEEMANAASEGASEFTRMEKNVKRVQSTLDKIQEGASTGQITKEGVVSDLQEVRTQLAKVEADGEEAAMSMGEIGDKLKTAKGNARQLQNNTDSMAGSNAQARQSAMALGNIMSDLPHGPAAAANNVGNLIEGFSHAKQEIGGIKATMKAMLGPALFAGAITGIVTIISNWDRFQEKIVAAKESLSGMTDQQMAYNKKVRDLIDQMPEKFVSGMTDEEQQSQLEHYEELVDRLNLIEDATSNIFGGMPADANRTADRARSAFDRIQKAIEGDRARLSGLGDEKVERLSNMSFEDFAREFKKGSDAVEAARDKLKQLRIEQEATEEAARKYVEDLIEANDALDKSDKDRLVEERLSGEDEDAIKKKQRKLEKLKIKMQKQGVEERIALQKRELRMKKKEALSQAKTVYGVDSPILDQIRAHFNRREKFMKRRLRREAEMRREAARDVGETEFAEGGDKFGVGYGGTQVESSLGGGNAPTHNETGNEGNLAERLLQSMIEKASSERKLGAARDRNQIRRETAPGSIARMSRMATSRRDTQMGAVNSRLSRLRQRRDMMEGSATEAEMNKVNAKIDRALKKRLDIRRKYLQKKKQIQKKEEQREQRQRKRRLSALNKFAGNISNIGNAISSLYQTWRKQRVRELKKEGKSQREINKIIKKEGRKRFERQKKLKIAGATMSAISSAALGFNSVWQTSLPLWAKIPLSASVAASNLASGYAQVQKLRATTIGGGGGGIGGGVSKPSIGAGRFSGNTRSSRVRNFTQERERDRRTGQRDTTEKAIREENAKTRDAIREGMAIGDEESFDATEAANDYEEKAISG